MKLLPTSIAVTLVGLVGAGTAAADTPKKVEISALPRVGDMLGENPAPWPKQDWLYEGPSGNDAAGKIIVHWFCAPKLVACTEDLARMIELRDHGKVYIVAHINGSKKDAAKLDPIQGSEGVGRGTVSYGKGVTSLMKTLGTTGPTSIVIGVDGKVAMVTTATSATELEPRDRKILALAGAIKEYVSSTEGVKLVKAGEKFTLAMTVKLARWLKFSKKQPMEFKLTAPPDIKCDSMTLTGDQLKIDADNQLVAQVSCSGTKGSYELRGDLRFGYDTPSGGQGLGQDGASWKLDIRAEGGLGGK